MSKQQELEDDVEDDVEIDDEEDYDLYLSENGHLSFRNPNYHGGGVGETPIMPLATIGSARLADHINSNIQSPNIFEELRYVCRESHYFTMKEKTLALTLLSDSKWEE